MPNSAVDAANAAALMQAPSAQVTLDSIKPVVDQIAQVAQKNTETSAKFAAEQNAWQKEQNRIAMDFNMQEAAKNRQWQEYMSNTAHQREVADLRAAGLNPVLSATGGNGAAVTSGATASGVSSAGAKGEVDTSLNGAMVSVLSSFLAAQQNAQMANINAINNMALAQQANATSVRTANINAGAIIEAAIQNALSAQSVAQLNQNTQLGVAGLNLQGTKYSSDKHLEGTKYSSDQSSLASQYKVDTDAYLRKYFPSSVGGIIGTIGGNAKELIEGAVNDIVNAVKGKKSK